MSLPTLVLLFCPCGDCALARLPTPLDPPNYKEQRPTAAFIGIRNGSRVSSATIDNSERNTATVMYEMTLLRLQTGVSTGRDNPIAASDSFCFSLLDSVSLFLLSKILLDCRNIFAFSRNARIVSSPPSFIIICLP